MTPTNYTTEKEYTGGNIFLLLDTPFNDQRWATYKQRKDAGFQVQKGQKGIRLTKIVTVKDKKTGEPYFLLVEGKYLTHPMLEAGDRKRMKILRVDPNADLEVTVITSILDAALDLYRSGKIKTNKR